MLHMPPYIVLNRVHTILMEVFVKVACWSTDYSTELLIMVESAGVKRSNITQLRICPLSSWSQIKVVIILLGCLLAIAQLLDFVRDDKTRNKPINNFSLILQILHTQRATF